MEKQASFSKVIRLPDKMTPGSYIAIVQVRYGNGVGTSSEIFHVIEKEKKLTIALTILAIMVFLIIAIKQINLRNRKFKKPKRKDNKLLQVELWKKEGYKTIDVKKK